MANIINQRKDFIAIQLDVSLKQEGAYIVAYCPALQLSSFGTDEPDAQKAFEEAAREWVTYLIEEGRLEAALLDLRWAVKA